MKGAQVVLDKIRGALVAAHIVDGVVEDLILDPPADGPPRIGSIYNATADRPMKGQGGQIVRLAKGLNGFLRGSNGLRPGQHGLVQVTGYAEAGKAVPVSSKLLFKGRYVIATPRASGVNISRQINNEERRVQLAELMADECPEVTGAIMRSAAADAKDADVVEEASRLWAAAQSVLKSEERGIVLPGPDAHDLAWINWSEVPVEGFVSSGVADLVDAARGAKCGLDGGGTMWVEPTHALVAVDVNTGGDTSPAAGLKANIDAARALPRRLRCLGLAGQVVVDFAPFAKKDRRTLEQVLRAAFKSDAVETSLVGWTPLGHFELNRKRERYPTG